MKKQLLSVFCMLLTSIVMFQSSLHAAKLHAILVADTITADDDFDTALDQMKRVTKKIAAGTDLKLNMLSFEGYQVRSKNVLKQIKKIKVRPNDVIILYTVTHGSRSFEKVSPWPDFDFQIDMALNDEYLAFERVNDFIKSKNPRLFLSMAECCNSYRNNNGVDFDDDFDFEDDNEENDDEVDEKDYKKASGKKSTLKTSSCHKELLTSKERKYLKNQMDDDCIRVYQDLFLKKKGSVIVSSSSPGQTAKNTSISGPIYTTEFLRAFKTALQIGDFAEDLSNWKFVLELASSTTAEILAEKNLGVAVPQYEINLSE